jgi:hypothetical protein
MENEYRPPREEHSGQAPLPPKVLASLTLNLAEYEILKCYLTPDGRWKVITDDGREHFLTDADLDAAQEKARQLVTKSRPGAAAPVTNKRRVKFEINQPSGGEPVSDNFSSGTPPTLPPKNDKVSKVEHEGLQPKPKTLVDDTAHLKPNGKKKPRSSRKALQPRKQK